MKQFVMTFCLLVAFSATQLMAQRSSFYIGANAGMNASKYKFTEDLKELYPTSNPVWGLNGGVDMGLKLNNWTLSTGVSYIQKGAEYQTNNFNDEGATGYFTGKEKLHFLSIPVLVGYRDYLVDKVGWNIAIGPSFNFGLAGKIDETTEYFGSDEVLFENYTVNYGEGVNDDYKKTQVGFQISPGLFVDLNSWSKVKFNVTWDFGTGDMFSKRYKAANDFFDINKGTQAHRNTMFTVAYEYHFPFEDKY
ncbi:MAG: porin family protein [Bacteroidota bacterium]